MTIQALIAVFIGGGIGSLCRYLVSTLVLRSEASVLPFATLIANVLSCIVMAVALNWFMHKIPEGSWQRLFLLVGFCGGFSTFSTFSLENFHLLKAGQFGWATVNIVLSIVLCLFVFWVLAKKI